MVRWRWAWLGLVWLTGSGEGWWYVPEEDPPAQNLTWWERPLLCFQRQLNSTKVSVQDRVSTLTSWDSAVWMVLDTLLSGVGWLVFGQSWHSVRTGCSLILSIAVLMVVCLVLHYFLSLAWPLCSLFIGTVLTLVWFSCQCQKTLNVKFHNLKFKFHNTMNSQWLLTANRHVTPALSRMCPLRAVFHTEMQRIDYNVQTPLQLARVDERIDEDSGQWIVLGFFDQYVTMMKGFAFKILAPKDITGVLNMIGVHPAVVQENIERPVADNAMAFFNALAEFAYDMDTQQVKAQMPAGILYPEIYDEAMDVLTVFKLSRQLAIVNLVDDFNFKDFWEPISKRFRALLSGMINFCRYKEAKVIVITGMKEDVQALDAQRLELVEKLNQVDSDLGAAQVRHNAELQDMWKAENEAGRKEMLFGRLSKR
ncbi:Probable kinetochore protein NUF2 [Durusdinium trenchii]|uniref:Probable kinetochore protein NUF2 n=1 Tax=Durusdinium trenchii TaxID=1381693 RepID=A0ABP0RTY8_9DINO